MTYLFVILENNSRRLSSPTLTSLALGLNTSTAIGTSGQCHCLRLAGPCGRADGVALAFLDLKIGSLPLLSVRAAYRYLVVIPHFACFPQSIVSIQIWNAFAKQMLEASL
jgi:hypothetical protein